MITIQDFSFTYKGEKKPALQDVCLTVPEGGFLGVIGPAGAGKTTLARAVSGMIPHHYTGDYYGRVSVNGLDTVETSLSDISRLVGMVFQDVESQIISPMVEDEILYGLENFGVPREEIPARMEEAMERVGIADLRERTIGSLSGGQVLDEHTGELDPRSSRKVFSLLKELNEEQGITVIVIEQKIMLLGEFAKQLAVLSDGKVLRQGETREVLAHSDELEAAGVNCPRVTTLSRLLKEKTGEEQPVCVNLDEAEDMVRRLIP